MCFSKGSKLEFTSTRWCKCYCCILFIRQALKFVKSVIFYFHFTPLHFLFFFFSFFLSAPQVDRVPAKSPLTRSLSVVEPKSQLDIDKLLTTGIGQALSENFIEVRNNPIANSAMFLLKNSKAVVFVLLRQR